VNRTKYKVSSIKFGTTLFLILCAWYVSSAQASFQDKYPFLKTDKNRIDFYGDSTKFNAFFNRLDEVILKGDGQVNVLHMGGSHVQGGSLSHAMRRHFQSLAPGLKGQRGLVFPFDAARTNNPWNYVVKKRGDWEGARVSVSDHYSEWGVSGITATATDPASTVSVYSRDTVDAFSFTKARIFYHMCECSYEPILMNKDIVSARRDSVKQFVEITFRNPQDTLHLTLRKKDSTQSQFILQGFQFLSEGPSVVYNPIGVNGAKTSDYLKGNLFAEQAKVIAPDLVIFGIGINDANTYAKAFDQRKYEANYDSLIAILKASNPNMAILFMTNNDSYFYKRYPNPNAYKVRDAMINLAKKHNAAVWDLFEIMGGFDSIRIWEAYNLASSDKIHFTRDGYVLQADLLFFALKNAYGDYLSARFRKQP
jgi:lysophospholipase L1-like esterase